MRHTLRHADAAYAIAPPCYADADAVGVTEVMAYHACCHATPPAITLPPLRRSDAYFHALIDACRLPLFFLRPFDFRLRALRRLFRSFVIVTISLFLRAAYMLPLPLDVYALMPLRRCRRLR